ncbi:ficolin-2-like [Anopheles marshallii]|uniref:ficolin-2-like n=1 Tax=Anopheles marshallii TaxID=1521116 RepID=UPI00237B0F3B|nr:ficolin-2-like [Anopheles marshallii]
MSQIKIVLALISMYSVSHVQCELNSSMTSASSSGFAFEMVMAKMQLLEQRLDLCCSASNMPLVKEQRSSQYTSCSKIPFPVSGVYTIQPEKLFKEPITVLCDQEYESGGWTVIQHRFDGSTNFYRSWQEYKNGFGNLDGEFWLGLDRIYHLTVSGAHELVILLEDFDGNKTYAKYDQFEIGNENQKYAITKLGEYSGTAGDSMHNAKGMKFSTFDNDNDISMENCANLYTGAWCYDGISYFTSNLNGKYLRGKTKESASSMVWNSFTGYHSLKMSKMLIKPKSL